VPAREIPVPAHLSAAAQAMTLKGSLSSKEYPPLDDTAAWRAYVAGLESEMASLISKVDFAVEPMSSVGAQEIEIEGVRVFTNTPTNISDDGAVFLDIHGGGLIVGGGATCRVLGGIMAQRVGAITWSVDYRMPPDHPYPAGLDDCVAVYSALLDKVGPQKIIVGGISAGGNLAAALILKARDQGMPLPAAAVLLSPELDLTHSGDSFSTNAGLDVTLTNSLMPANLLYAAGHALADPYVSPLFGDFSRGFPPTLLSAGTRDLFLSNAVRMHRALRAADVPADLHILEAASHSNFMGAPEGKEIDREVRRFTDAHWNRNK
jgi:monoterpene epsilon-lactone hydrolase